MRIFTPFLCLPVCSVHISFFRGPWLTQSAGSGTLLDVVLAVKSRPFRIKDSSCIIRTVDSFVHFLFSSRVGGVPFSFINEPPPPPLHKWLPSLTCCSVFYPAFFVCLHPLLSIDRYIQQLMRCVNLHNTHTHRVVGLFMFVVKVTPQGQYPSHVLFQAPSILFSPYFHFNYYFFVLFVCLIIGGLLLTIPSSFKPRVEEQVDIGDTRRWETLLFWEGQLSVERS